MLRPESGTKSDRPVLSIERHLERIKKAEEGLAKAEWDRKDVLRNLWNATVLLKDALARDEGGKEEELEKPVVVEKPTSGNDGEALEVANARSLES